MVHLPVRKCYYAAKLAVVFIIVVTILALFEQWRGGKRNTQAAYSNPVDAEYERQILEDEARIVPGLGEGGVAVYLEGEDKRLGEESEKKLALNMYLSDKIPYNRTLKDFRHPACARVVYDAELPSASVIIIFHNEPYSVVIRTIWSVINSARRDQPWYRNANFVDQETGRTMTLGYPGQDPSSEFVYLKEIILVDDNSTLPELKGKLSHYVRTRLPPDLIRILRLPDRGGIAHSRYEGSRVATADVMIFLDSHCEAVVDWLRPLLQRIKEKPSAVLTPLIDVLSRRDFEYQAGYITDVQGLIKARIAGARVARGDALIFLDAHCEGGRDWLRPLLQRIRNKRDAAVTPLIDVIDQTTFQVDAAEHFQVGGFTFMGHFTWIDVPEREKKRRGSDIAPTWSPTMAGGLFAINRAYYWELGAYDEQMAGWGGENLELSFRIWQCGGTLETIPCSRVGHVFRSFHPYGLPADSDTHGINTARMAEVWMDEYAELFYLHRPDLRKNPKIGDVTHRKVLREKLHCKSFQWYLDNIYKEKFVPVRDAFAYGRFRNPKTKLCLDTMQREAEGSTLGVYPCHETLVATQYLTLTLTGELRDEEKCAELGYYNKNAPISEEDDEGHRVVMTTCRPKKRQLKWRYLPKTHQLQHVDSELCLTASRQAGEDAVAKRCNPDRPLQKWDIDFSELNDFKSENNIESKEQEETLRRLRGQRPLLESQKRSRRQSRSLLSYDADAGGDVVGNTLTDSGENSTARRHTSHAYRKTKRTKSKRKKSSKKRKTKRVAKNKFILKLVRTLMNNTQEHLEVDVYCKHKQLYPNNTFVRDLVTILNERNIKVINNGRIFERNKVTDLTKDQGVAAAGKNNKPKVVGQKTEAVEETGVQPRGDDVTPVTKEPTPQHHQSKKHKQDKPDSPPPVSAVNPVAMAAAVRASPHKKIIIEDFVEVKPMSSATVIPMKKRKRRRKKSKAGKNFMKELFKKRKHKRKRARLPLGPLVQPAGEGGRADGGGRGEAAGHTQKGYRAHISEESPMNTAQMSMEDAPMVSQEFEYRNRDASTAERKRDKLTSRVALTGRDDDEGKRYEDTDNGATKRDDYIVEDRKEYQIKNREAGGEDLRTTGKRDGDMPVVSGENEMEDQGSDGLWPVAEPVMRARTTRRHRQRPAGDADPADNDVSPPRGPPSATSPPLKVVMKSNLTFNLGDEFFSWRRRNADDEVVDLLEELEIPANASRSAPPVQAWVRPEPSEAPQVSATPAARRVNLHKTPRMMESESDESSRSSNDASDT